MSLRLAIRSPQLTTGSSLKSRVLTDASSPPSFFGPGLDPTVNLTISSHGASGYLVPIDLRSWESFSVRIW